MIIGLVLEISGILVSSVLIGPYVSPWILAFVFAVYGAGVGLTSAQLASVVLAEVPVTSSGMGSATQSTARQVGSTLGAARRHGARNFARLSTSRRSGKSGYA